LLSVSGLLPVIGAGSVSAMLKIYECRAAITIEGSLDHKLMPTQTFASDAVPCPAILREQKKISLILVAAVKPATDQ
jgi:hypothetical protein